MTPKKLAEKVNKLNKILEVGTKGRTTEEMIVYKKVMTKKGYAIATLLIPKGAQVSHETMWDSKYRFTAARACSQSEKCRANVAKVLEIQEYNESAVRKWGKKLKHAVSMYAPPRNWGCAGPRMPYRVGRTVYPDSFDPSPDRTCSHGIHFFTTIEEAIDY